MPDSLTRSFSNPPAALLERRFDLPDEDATLAFGGRFAQAIALFREISLAPEFVEFLTIPAYRLIV